MTRSGPRRLTVLTRPVGLAAALALSLSLAACNGDGDDEPGGGGDGPSTSTGATSDPTDSPEPTDPETDTTEPAAETPLGTGVAPADGELVELDALSLRLPRSWEVTTSDRASLIAGTKRFSIDDLTIISITNDGLTSSVDQARRYEDQSDGFAKDPPAMDPVVVDGVEMFHRSGRVAENSWVESFGSNSTPYRISILFELDPDNGEKAQRELADSILQTVDLTE